MVVRSRCCIVDQSLRTVRTQSSDMPATCGRRLLHAKPQNRAGTGANVFRRRENLTQYSVQLFLDGSFVTCCHAICRDLPRLRGCDSGEIPLPGLSDKAKSSNSTFGFRKRRLEPLERLEAYWCEYPNIGPLCLPMAQSSLGVDISSSSRTK